MAPRSDRGSAPPACTARVRRRITPRRWRGALVSSPASRPPSSRGLGRRPLTAETGVRIPVAVLKSPANWQILGAAWVAGGSRSRREVRSLHVDGNPVAVLDEPARRAGPLRPRPRGGSQCSRHTRGRACSGGKSTAAGKGVTAAFTPRNLKPAPASPDSRSSENGAATRSLLLSMQRGTRALRR